VNLLLDTFLEEIKRLRLTPLEIALEHADLAGRLPPIHADPFDRMLIGYDRSPYRSKSHCLVSRMRRFASGSENNILDQCVAMAF
jgi:PIN domain nuclease of toxin-antitoxin system